MQSFAFIGCETENHGTSELVFVSFQTTFYLLFWTRIRSLPLFVCMVLYSLTGLCCCGRSPVELLVGLGGYHEIPERSLEVEMMDCSFQLGFGAITSEREMAWPNLSSFR